MKNAVLVVLITVVAISGFAQENAEVLALKKKVEQLEKRVKELEAAVAPIIQKNEIEQRINEQRAKARLRMRQDAKIYSRRELQEIEQLYQVANQKWGSQEGKDSLKVLIEKYDKANRTGCALLYLGQMSEGKQREEYLTKAIDKFSDCFYGDGVQVGAYARYILAHHYKQTGNGDQADKLFAELKTNYPDAISHKGYLLNKPVSK